MKVELIGDPARIHTFEGTIEEFEKLQKLIALANPLPKQGKAKPGMMDKINSVLEGIAK